MITLTDVWIAALRSDIYKPNDEVWHRTDNGFNAFGVLLDVSSMGAWIHNPRTRWWFYDCCSYEWASVVPDEFLRLTGVKERDRFLAEHNLDAPFKRLASILERNQ